MEPEVKFKPKYSVGNIIEFKEDKKQEEDDDCLRIGKVLRIDGEAEWTDDGMNAYIFYAVRERCYIHEDDIVRVVAEK